MITWGPSVHALRVSLRDVEPTVWRRIAVPSETKLPRFARMLEAVMGWDGYHLHSFSVAGLRFGEPDEDDDDVIDERRVTVKQILPSLGSALQWDYDFGDGWEHDVVVEGIEEPSPSVRYPVCLDGSRACPPQDCGGASGYAELLEVLANPMHEEHEHMRGWAPEGVDAAHFDVVVANQRLRGRR
jgi:hypothetical protein